MNFNGARTLFLWLSLFIMHIGSFHWWKGLFTPGAEYVFAVLSRQIHFLLDGYAFYLTLLCNLVSLHRMPGFMYNSITHRCLSRSIRLHKLSAQSVYGFAIKRIYSGRSPQGRPQNEARGPGWSVKPWSQSPKVLEASASKPLILMTLGLFTY